MLTELSNMYKNFPYYIIEIMAEDYIIPETELKILIPDFLHRGHLNRVGENLFKLNRSF